MADVTVNEDNTDHKQLYGQGIKAFIMQDFEVAVKAFSRVSELLVQELQDDVHDNLGDVYLYYGKALLELARKDLENSCLNKSLIKNAESSSDDEGNNAAVGNTENEAETAAEGEDDDDAAGDKNEDEEKTEVENKETKDDKTESPGPSGEGTSKSADPDHPDENSEKEEDLTDLQVAWEVLELARKIFTKRGEPGRKDLAETMVALGEVSLENENFAQAIEDMLQGLEIQKIIFASDSRAIAETYYKLGGAYYCNKQIDEAIEQFQNSCDYLKSKLENLKKNDDPSDDDEDEIKELEELIPEVDEKIADMKSCKFEQLTITKTIEEDKKESANGASSSSSSKPATDISHLVKRKRTAEGPTVNGIEEHPPAKKPTP